MKYTRKVVHDAAGNEYALSSEVDSEEGDNSITKTLEVGYAFGLSSLHICEALRNGPGASHLIIDPT
jgi:hypothetical protein